MHAGSTDGFIPGAELVFPSKTKDADYHGEMNQVNFVKWFRDLLLLLPCPSVIIMDNAPYHNTLVSKIPNSSSTKPEIEQWLNENNVEFKANSLKRELLLKVAL